MALAHSPKIVTDGLVLSLDAANTKSYSGSGTTVNNLISSNHAGTLIGNATTSSDNKGVFVLDGTGDSVNIAGTPVGANAYTKMIWFRLDNGAQSGNNNLMSSSAGGNIMWVPTGNTLRAAHTDTSFSLVTSSVTCEEERWYHGVVTFNTTSGWVLYQDGAVVDTDATTSVRPGTGAVDVGTYGGGSNMTGKLSCPMVYSRALTDAEVLQSYNALKGRFGL